MRKQTWLKSFWPQVHFNLQHQHWSLTQLQSDTFRLPLLGGKILNQESLTGKNWMDLFTCLTALSISQSWKIIKGDLPPSSKEHFFKLLMAQLWVNIQQKNDCLNY